MASEKPIRTHCPKNHALTGENAYYEKGSTRARCRTCRTNRSARYVEIRTSKREARIPKVPAPTIELPTVEWILETLGTYQAAEPNIEEVVILTPKEAASDSLTSTPSKRKSLSAIS